MGRDGAYRSAYSPKVLRDFKYRFGRYHDRNFRMQKSEPCECVLSAAINRGLRYLNEQDYEGI